MDLKIWMYCFAACPRNGIYKLNNIFTCFLLGKKNLLFHQYESPVVATQTLVWALTDDLRVVEWKFEVRKWPCRFRIHTGGRVREPDLTTSLFLLSQVEERSRLNRQSSPAMPHKVANRISDPNLPPRSESFSISGVQTARTPPLLRPVDPQV